MDFLANQHSYAPLFTLQAYTGSAWVDISAKQSGFDRNVCHHTVCPMNAGDKRTFTQTLVIDSLYTPGTIWLAPVLSDRAGTKARSSSKTCMRDGVRDWESDIRRKGRKPTDYSKENKE
ncbi:unnamed protein product, partial [Oppiella nova]